MLRRALFIINRIILNPNNILKINFGFYFVKSLDNPRQHDKRGYGHKTHKNCRIGRAWIWSAPITIDKK